MLELSESVDLIEIFLPLIVWQGTYANVIEKSKSADLVQLIVQRRDLGCKKAQRVLLVDEEKVSAANLGNKIFWKLLGSNQTHTKAPEDAGPPEEDENYEIEVNILILILENIRITDMIKDSFRTCNVLPFSCTHLALWRTKAR